MEPTELRQNSTIVSAEFTNPQGEIVTVEYERKPFSSGVNSSVHRGRIGETPCAVKVSDAMLRPREEVIAEMQSEYELLLGFDHPNIIKAFAIRTLENGDVAIAMELVEGKTLDKVLKENVHSPDEIVFLLT